MSVVLHKIQGHTLGYVTLAGPDGVLVYETHTCQHCGCGVDRLHGQVLEDIGAICHGGGGGTLGCGEFICKLCAKIGDCKTRHIEAWMAEAERAERMRVARGIHAPTVVNFDCAHCCTPVRFDLQDNPDAHAGGCGACHRPLCAACVELGTCPTYTRPGG